MDGSIFLFIYLSLFIFSFSFGVELNASNEYLTQFLNFSNNSICRYSAGYRYIDLSRIEWQFN